MPGTIRLFISHASADAELAGRLVDLFRSSLNLPASAIRCTSVDGYRLPGGADTDDQLRREVVDEAEVFVGIVSGTSMRSVYVLFELGARWAVRKHLVPLLAPGAPVGLLGGPLAGLTALRADNVAQLYQLVAEIGDVLSIPPESPASYQSVVERIAVSHAVGPAVAPPPAAAAAAPGVGPTMGAGASGDTAPPRLVEFEIPSPTVDVSARRGDVELRAHLVDDLSGVAGRIYRSSPTQVRFRSPSGKQFVDALFVAGQHLQHGTAQDGFYRSLVEFPRYAESGIWRVEYFLLVDECGNSATLRAEDMEAMGFPTTITVHAG